VVLDWGVKTRSGFRIEPDVAAARRVEQGANYWLVAQRWYRSRYLRALLRDR
jgi:hypothetical protein